jgi:integrase
LAKRPTGKPTRYPGVTRLPDGRFLLRAKVENPKTGRTQERERIVECATAAEAVRLRDELRDPAGGVDSRKRVRLSDFSISWLSGKRKEIKAATLDRYTRTLAHHIVPQLGDYYVDALTHNDIVEWRNAQDSQASTINGRLRVLKKLMADATIIFDLPRDPALRVKALSETGGAGYCDEDPNALTAEQLAAFLDTAKRMAKGRWYPLLATLAFTGMRVGEVTALKWDDILMPTDGSDGYIKVQRAHWMKHVGTTKTGKRMRVVPLAPELASILREHRRAQLARGNEDLPPAKRRGYELGLAAGWVFPSDKGEPTIGPTVRKPFRDVLDELAKNEALAMPHLTIHGLRRTLNNLLRQQAQGEVVRSVTGHVTERMTEHYSHVSRDEKSTAMAKVFSIVRPAKVTAAEVGDLVGDASG